MRHQICIIRIYGLFEAFVLRNDTAQLGERVPQSLSNDVIKLLRVRVPVIANFYDPTTFVFVMWQILGCFNLILLKCGLGRIRLYRYSNCVAVYDVFRVHCATNGSIRT